MCFAKAKGLVLMVILRYSYYVMLPLIEISSVRQGGGGPYMEQTMLASLSVWVHSCVFFGHFFSKVDNFCDFLFTFLEKLPLPKWGILLKERSKNGNDRVAPLERVPIHLNENKYFSLSVEPPLWGSSKEGHSIFFHGKMRRKKTDQYYCQNHPFPEA